MLNQNKIEIDNISEKLDKFLNRNDIRPSDVDTLILGNNGDEFDFYYKKASAIFTNEIPEIEFKQLSGEYPTSPAFGCWIGYKILENENIPKSLTKSGNVKNGIKTVLCYSQFKGRDHSFILLKR